MFGTSLPSKLGVDYFELLYKTVKQLNRQLVLLSLIIMK